MLTNYHLSQVFLLLQLNFFNMNPKDLTTVFLSCHALSSQHLKNDLNKLFFKLNTTFFKLTLLSAPTGEILSHELLGASED